MRLADLRFQCLDLVSLGLEELDDKVVVWDEAVVPAGRDDGLEIVADLLPPIDENAGALELVEHAQGDELVLERDQQLMPHIGQLLAIAKLREIVPGNRSTRLRAPCGATRRSSGDPGQLRTWT